jgi:hypothetical protein
MKTLAGVVGAVLLALSLWSGVVVAKGGRPQKTCTDGLFEYWTSFHWLSSCSSVFDAEGTNDVGGERTDRLHTFGQHGQRLVWYIQGQTDLTIAFTRFMNTGVTSPQPLCPGTFTVDDAPVTMTNPCEFVVTDNDKFRKLKLIVDPRYAGYIFKFTIVLTPKLGIPTSIDPELEMDTQLAFVAYALTALVGLIVLATGYFAYRRMRRAK